MGLIHGAIPGMVPGMIPQGKRKGRERKGREDVTHPSMTVTGGSDFRSWMDTKR